MDRTLGLALGSGSARGLAHIGVLRALDEAGLPVRVVAGTSIGALIGAVHAAGKIKELATTLQGINKVRVAGLLDVVLPKSGLIDGARISDLVRAHVSVETIAGLQLPFAAVATDLASGEQVVIRSGDLIEAVRASISVPGVFTPVLWDGRILVDGGLVNPVPVTAARELGADTVIAVDLNTGIVAGKNLKPLLTAEPVLAASRTPEWAQDIRQAVDRLTAWLLNKGAPSAARVTQCWAATEPLPNIFEVLLASINIMESRITEGRLTLDQPEVLIQPRLGHIRFLDFHRAEEIIEVGYRTTIEAIPAIRAAVARA